MYGIAVAQISDMLPEAAWTFVLWVALGSPLVGAWLNLAYTKRIGGKVVFGVALGYYLILGIVYAAGVKSGEKPELMAIFIFVLLFGIALGPMLAVLSSRKKQMPVE